MNKTTKKYIEMAKNYFKAAQILQNQLLDNPELFRPTIYLLRHSNELLLKGIIIDISKRNYNRSVKDISINGHKITQTHSLIDLWEYYLSIESPLCVYESQQVRRVLKRLDKRDQSSTYYRYPYRQNGKSVSISPIVLGEMPSNIRRSPMLIVEASGDIKAIEKGRKELSDLCELFSATETLFSIFC